MPNTTNWEKNYTFGSRDSTKHRWRCLVTTEDAKLQQNRAEVQRACFAAEDHSGHRNTMENKKLVLENTTLRKDLLKPKVEAS